MSKKGYTKEDAAKESKSSPKEVSEAWHGARDDAAKEGGWGVPSERHGGEKDSGSKDSGGNSGKQVKRSKKQGGCTAQPPLLLLFFYYKKVELIYSDMKKKPSFSREKTKKKSKNPPVCVLWWQDAYYSYEKELPNESPPIELTAGFIFVATDDYVNIATNVRYDKKDGTIWPIDGFVIPEKATLEFKKIGLLHEKK